MPRDRRDCRSPIGYPFPSLISSSTVLAGRCPVVALMFTLNSNAAGAPLYYVVEWASLERAPGGEPPRAGQRVAQDKAGESDPQKPVIEEKVS